MTEKHKITGLNDAQVAQSRSQHGMNVLTPPKKRSLWLQFMDCFNDPLIRILLVALLLSVGISIYEYVGLHLSSEVLLEPVGIFLAIVLATLVGFLVEINANKKFEILNKLNDDVAVKVMRNGVVTQIPRRDVVVGDVVMLDAGENVPADGELLESVSMSVDESSFTGEPLAYKSHKPEDIKADATYPTNRVLRGSNVADGHGMMQVTEVGDRTEYGKVFTEAQIAHDLETPLMKQFDQLGKWIARGSYIVGGLIIVGRLLLLAIDGMEHDALSVIQYLIETLMLAVTLIVVSVPEGLPMSVTLSLALSMRRMLASNNLVRKMHACETMGATTIICTDKTGTLTRNQMHVQEAYFPGLAETGRLSSDDASRIIALNMGCNSTAFIDKTDDNKHKAIGNPTEGALLLWLESAGIDYVALRDEWEIEAQLPFTTVNKYMATVVRNRSGRRLLLVKGASEIIVKHCGTIAGGVDFEHITAQLLQYQSQAMRTLGFAHRELTADAPCPIADHRLVIEGMTFDGIVGISDPVRPDVPDAIKECTAAGIEVKIVTGDTPGTAREIGRQVAIWHPEDSADALITGEEFAQLNDEEASERAKQIKVMSRARPADKARLVALLQKRGEVVAVTGDGTNDAPALNMAQVGLSMGDGTAVAKQASDITIMDNSFTSIGKAVMWGRSLYKNIQRFILFQLTVNLAACVVVGVGSFLSEQPALTVTQMLWINLIMDTFAALALASLPPSHSVMRDKPRKDGESIITRRMLKFIIGMGTVFAAVMLAIFIYLLFHHHSPDEGRSFITSQIMTDEMAIYFTTFVFLQFWNMFNAKAYDSGSSAFSNMKESKVFFAIMAVIAVGQVAIVQLGYKMFQVEPLSLKQWVLIVVGTSPVMLVGELVRIIKNAKHKQT